MFDEYSSAEWLISCVSQVLGSFREECRLFRGVSKGVPRAIVLSGGGCVRNKVFIEVNNDCFYRVASPLPYALFFPIKSNLCMYLMGREYISWRLPLPFGGHFFWYPFRDRDVTSLPVFRVIEWRLPLAKTLIWQPIGRKNPFWILAWRFVYTGKLTHSPFTLSASHIKEVYRALKIESRSNATGFPPIIRDYVGRDCPPWQQSAFNFPARGNWLSGQPFFNSRADFISPVINRKGVPLQVLISAETVDCDPKFSVPVFPDVSRIMG